MGAINKTYGPPPLPLGAAGIGQASSRAGRRRHEAEERSGLASSQLPRPPEVGSYLENLTSWFQTVMADLLGRGHDAGQVPQSTCY